MQSRIGSLHVRYRVPRGASIAAALVPSFERAIQTQLSDALGERLSAMLGADESVVVIREATARVVLRSSDWSLDTKVVDTIGRASADAIAAALGAPASDESLVRFANHAEFIGVFIVDLMAGTAWERWYFGAFHGYRRASPNDTIEAVLADNGTYAARVFSWLEGRGRLAGVLALLGPARARRLATNEAADRTGSTHAEVVPLAAAAFDLVEALGWSGCDEAVRTEVATRYLTTRPIPPTWTDRRSLTGWVLDLVRFAVDALGRLGAPLRMRDPEAVERLLTGALDWLDGDWLRPQLVALQDAPQAGAAVRPDTHRPVLAPRHERLIARLAELVRGGRVRPSEADDPDALIVRLIAIIPGEDLESGSPDRTVVSTIERVVDAWHAIIGAGVDPRRAATILDAPSGAPRLHALEDRGVGAAVEAVRRTGFAAVQLVRALVDASAVDTEAGEPTAGAGLFLLTRAVLDVRLQALAGAAGLPFELLLGALAVELLGLERPFDGPTAMWVGQVNPDLAALEESGARLAELRRQLRSLLIDQRTLDPDPDTGVGDADAQPVFGLANSAPTDRDIEAVASMVMRAWIRWLPGLTSSSPTFIVRNCLQRRGWVRVSDDAIDVKLEPAPLDVVLEMAGYLRPIERVPWLAGRRVELTVLRRPSA